MAEKLTATSDIEIKAEPGEVWAALTDLELLGGLKKLTEG